LLVSFTLRLSIRNWSTVNKAGISPDVPETIGEKSDLIIRKQPLEAVEPSLRCQHVQPEGRVALGTEPGNILRELNICVARSPSHSRANAAFESLISRIDADRDVFKPSSYCLRTGKRGKQKPESDGGGVYIFIATGGRFEKNTTISSIRRRVKNGVPARSPVLGPEDHLIARSRLADLAKRPALSQPPPLSTFQAVCVFLIVYGIWIKTPLPDIAVHLVDAPGVLWIDPAPDIDDTLKFLASSRLMA